MSFYYQIHLLVKKCRLGGRAFFFSYLGLKIPKYVFGQSHALPEIVWNFFCMKDLFIFRVHILKTILCLFIYSFVTF